MRGGVRWSMGRAPDPSDAAGQCAGLLARTRNVPATVGRVSALGVCRSSARTWARCVSPRLGTSPIRLRVAGQKRPRATDGKTPRITDRTNGARVRLPWGERRGAASTDLGRVKEMATHRHKRCIDATGTARLLSSSSEPICSQERAIGRILGFPLLGHSAPRQLLLLLSRSARHVLSRETQICSSPGSWRPHPQFLRVLEAVASDVES
jgi:hypothetical protein